MDECFIKTCLTINVFINLMRGCALMSWNWVMAHIPQQQQPGYFIFFCLFFKKVNFESCNFELCSSLDLEQFCSILAKIYLFSSVNVQLPPAPVRNIWKIHYVLQTSQFIYLFIFSVFWCALWFSTKAFSDVWIQDRPLLLVKVWVVLWTFLSIPTEETTTIINTVRAAVKLPNPPSALC